MSPHPMTRSCRTGSCLPLLTSRDRSSCHGKKGNNDDDNRLSSFIFRPFTRRFLCRMVQAGGSIATFYDCGVLRTCGNCAKTEVQCQKFGYLSETDCTIPKCFQVGCFCSILKGLTGRNGAGTSAKRRLCHRHCCSLRVRNCFQLFAMTIN